MNKGGKMKKKAKVMKAFGEGEVKEVDVEYDEIGKCEKCEKDNKHLNEYYDSVLQEYFMLCQTCKEEKGGR